MYELKVGLEDMGKRIDNVVTKNLVTMKPDLEVSRTLVQKMIENSRILLNGKIVKVGHKVNEGDRIEIDLERLEKESIAEQDRKIPKPEKIKLDIVYEDKDILVINKPAGMVVHPSCGNYSGTLVNALLNYPGFLTNFNEQRTTNDDHRESRAKSRDERRIMRPGIVHRLDKDTSGVMVVAKTGVAHRKLSRQLKDRIISKKYIAVVKGVLELDEGIINAPINHDRKNRLKMAIDKEFGKEALTYYKVTLRNKEKNFSVLEVTAKTGRTHQIRVHLAHIGHPVLGDTLYNGPEIQGLSRQALHAKSISFIHPTKNSRMEFSAEIPRDLKQFL